MDIFIHIPKCGGSTIRDAMISHYGTESVVKVYGGSWSPNYFSKEGFIRALHDGFDAQVKALCGHFSLSDLDDYVDANARMFTAVRDPIEREISNINYLKVSPGHRRHQYGMGINETNLFDRLRNKRSNIQSDVLSFDGSESRLKELHDRIQIFRVENISELLISLGYLKSEDGLEIKNVTKERLGGLRENDLVRVEMLSKDQVSSLRDVFSRDYLLYESAK